MSGTTSPRGTLSKLKNRFSRSFGSGTHAKDGAGAPAATSSAPGGGGEATQTSAPAPATASQTQAPQSESAVPTQPQPEAQPAQAAAASTEQPTTTSTSAGAPTLPDYTPDARSLNGTKSTLRTLYPPFPTTKTGTLKVSDASNGDHELYYEISGKEGGYPVVYLHGGPGGGTTEDDRRWFDPSHYQILVFDQRGSGKSTPSAELKGNTTWDLVEDIEKLRKEVMKVEKWHVFGGSWGSTLSLAYAQTHPERVSALILRGIFTLRRAELEFFYQHGSGWIWPEQFKP